MSSIVDEVYWVIQDKVLGVRKPTNMKEVGELKDIPIGGLISLLDDEENHDLYNEAKLNFLWIPIKGGGCPTIDQITKAKSYMDSFWNNNEAVAVHCSGGRKRTATLIGGVLRLNGYDFQRVMDCISKANAEIKLKDDQVNFLKNL